MAQGKPNYEVNDEFNNMAVKIVEKYPEKFHDIEVDKICCVNTDKPRKEVEGVLNRIWRVRPVRMPEAIHNPYGWYVVLHASDWEELSEKHKLAVVADALHGIPNGEDGSGKVNSCNVNGYFEVFETFGMKFMDDPDIPHILDEDVVWKS